MSVALHSFADDAALVASLAPALAARLRSGIDERGAAVLIVSGGRTPVPLFRRLAAETLDWSRVTVTLADERWVAPEHSDANARLVAEELLQGPAAAASFLPLTTGATDPYGEEAAIDLALTKLNWPVDAIVLGMGEDGHTASLFPGARELTEALAGKDSSGSPSRCCAVTPPTAPHRRMTLTLPALLDCRFLVLQLGGSSKRRVLKRAMDEGAVAEMPVRALLRQEEITLNIYCSDDKESKETP